jgi:hypothetical protein
MRFARALLVFGLMAACDGTIDGRRPPVDPIEPVGGGTAGGTFGGGGVVGGGGAGSVPDAGPVPCEPGTRQVTRLLRLSNHEYRTMVADVLGVAVDPALFTRWTPVASVYGFDTMSQTPIDAQGLEEQLATAESLAGLVLATPALTAQCPAVRPVQMPVCALKTRYSALDDFSDTQARDCWSYLDSNGTPMAFDNANARWQTLPNQGNFLWRNGAHPGSTLDAVRRWVSPVDGAITLSGSFAAVDTNGGDGVRATITKNGAVVFTQDIPRGGTAPFSLQFAVTRGERLDFIVNRKTSASYDTTAFSAAIGFTATPRKVDWTWANCVEPLVTRLASRSFRRPARPAELAGFQALFTTNLNGATTAGFSEPMDHALTAVLQALFLSPNFVFKPELVPEGLDPAERQFGVASKLSLYFRGSLADEQLWQLAGTGQLSTAAQVRTQAERLATQDLQRFATSFGGQWLDFRDQRGVGPLGNEMQRESFNMFAAVLQDDLPPERLLSPGFTIAETQLARHYALTGPVGTAPYFRFLTTQRGGLLSQAAMLSRTANGSDFRRAIHRGLWVLSRLLCRPLPHLDAATLEEIANAGNTIDRSRPLSEQMAQHRNTSMRCGGCHNMIDPIGLALEKYDGQGLWRDTYPNGQPVVSNLDLDGVIVRDPLELSNAIEASPDFRACVAQKLLTFGLNRGPEYGEACVSEEIARPKDGSRPSLKAMSVEALMRSLQLTEVGP